MEQYHSFTRLLKFNGRITCGELRCAFIKSKISETEDGDYINRRTLQVEFHDAPTMYIHNDVYGCICGSVADNFDEETIMEFLRLIYTRSCIDFDECVTGNEYLDNP